ncbi:MAG: DUF4845 domain-containing protein [Pseudomonadales bacterium]
MSLPRYQKGMGFVGWILLILIFGGILTLGLRLFPHYLDHNTVAGVLDGLGEIDGLGSQPTATIRDRMKKRLNVNNVRDFPIEENIKIERSGTAARIVMDYEVRVPVVYNLDLVATFNKEVRLRN